MTKYNEGDFVEYKPVGGQYNLATSTGRILRVLTFTDIAGDTKIHAQASEEHPRYEILNSKTGKKSAYDDSSIVRVIQEE